MFKKSYVDKLLIIPGLIALIPLVFPLQTNAEPLIWKASPSTTGSQWHISRADAVADFQSKSSFYAYMTEALEPEYINGYTTDYIKIKYKIPDTNVNIGPWDYFYRNSDYGCPHFSTEDGAIDCFMENKINYLLGLNKPSVCGIVLEIDRSSGQWDYSRTNTIGGYLGINTMEIRDYDQTQHGKDVHGSCTIRINSLFRLGRNRTITCDYPTTLYDQNKRVCTSIATAVVYGYPYHYMTFEPKICTPKEGNPCNPATGNKVQTENDYVQHNMGLKVVRYYASQGIGDGYDELGPRWRHNYTKRIDGYKEPAYTSYQGAKSSLYQLASEACTNGWAELKNRVYGGLLSEATAAYRYGVCEIKKAGILVAKLKIHNTLNGAKDSGTSTKIHNITSDQGQANTYSYLGGKWQPLYNNQSSFTQTDTGWSLALKDNTVEQYDDDGKLTSSTNPKGQMILFSYDGEGRLHRVIGYFGDTLTYSYDASGHLATINTPDGDLNYGYDSAGRLISVTYPDNRTRQYHYEDSRFPNHLTGITDENGDRYATWAYDAEGRAILSEHAGNAERVEFTYNPDGTTTVTDAAGAERIYHFTVQQGQMKVDHIEGDRCTTCSGGDIQAYSYDSNGFIVSKTDWNGNTTTYTRDTQGRELSRTEASGTPQARTITTTWDTTLNKPLTVTDPEQITEYTYDTEGRLLSRQQSPIQ
ncbi:MAG: DUF6531 domain-containing protein [Candidatus Thiodiazotropha taylori]|nr:DUF6531 domain-containing protein [Candidatus Thiodiazotropha taylori]